MSREGETSGPKDGAMVFRENGQVTLEIPEMRPNQTVPEHLMLLAAMACRANDERWRAEQIAWFGHNVRAHALKDRQP